MPRTAACLLALAALAPPACSHPTIDVLTLEAIDALGFKPAEAAASVPLLTDLLKSHDATQRWHAARALGNLGESATPAAPALVKLLKDDDPVVVVHASVALAKIGDKSQATVTALLSKVTAGDERVARNAIGVLRQLSVEPEVLAGFIEQLLEADDAAVMSHAVEAIVSRGAEAGPLLNAALAKEKAAYWAAIAVGEIGPPAAATTPSLVELLGRSDDPETRQLALVALGKIGPAAVEAVATVEKVARETQQDGERIAACYALGAMGADSSTALLRDLESSGGPFQAMVCAWSLAKTHPDDPDALNHALEQVVAGLKSDREAMRNAAAAGLRELDAPPEQAGDALVAAVRAATPEQRSHIAAAMASLGPEVVPKAVAALADEDLRPVAIEVLGRLGAEAGDGVAELTRVLDAEAASVVARAQYALASIGEQAGAAAGELADNLSHEAEQVRHSALFALRQLGAAAQPAAEKLDTYLQQADDEFERFATAWAMTKIKLNAAVLGRVAAALSLALDSENERVRLETIAAIADLDAMPAALKAKLKKLAESDPSSAVREAASAAIE